MNTKMKRSTATWIWDFAGEYRSRYVLSVLSAVCGVICGILPYFVMANMIGDLLGGCRDTNIYLQHCLVMALLWVGRCGFHSISTTLSHKATFAVLGNIRKRVCEKLTRVPLGTVLDMPSGSVKNVLVERIDSIETTMAHIIPEFTSNLLVPIALLVYLFVLDWRMALAVLATVPIGFGCYAGMTRGYAESYQNTGLTHSQTLMVMAQDLLKQLNLTAKDMEAVAVAAGPGSFTGVRIGVAAAKGFAWGREIPCVGTSTLESMALGLGAWQGYVCPVMDARRSQVYNGLFHVSGGNYARVQEDRAISLADLGEELKILREPIFLVGDGSNLCYNTLLEKVPGLVLPPEHRMHQRAAGVALAAERMLQEGGDFSGAALMPNYLRLSQAERERLERENSK